MVAAFGSAAATNSIRDVALARALFVVGSNTTEQHPIIGIEMKKALRAGAALIVADPRRTELAGLAHFHLALRPGTDIALLNGMAHVILAEGLW
ncbi:MAG: molybdopterin-dependent oxidoreductase, partial [candidate division NC10 bacterium]|nr:molybdopterin-dependent oxidoreductase [candidate division NC10 bacterium]